MRGRARALGHAIHSIVIVFPLGLLITASVFDVIGLISDGGGFAVASAYAIAAGLIGGLVASATGWIDWSAIPAGTRAKRVGLAHGVGNGVVLLLFALSWVLRAGSGDWRPGALALVCGFAGVALAGVTGWLGGELVERLGVGVHEGAGPDAPSSLTHP